MKEIFEKLKKRVIPNNGLIWHYTAMPVLENFLRGTVALTHFRFLNDSKDLEYGLDLLRSLASSSDNELLKMAVLENKYSDALIKADSYLFCLSRASDSLYQWRSYSTTGGVAIGFHRTDLYNALFDAVVGDAEISAIHPMFDLLKCQYDDKLAERFIHKLAIRVAPEDTKHPEGFLQAFKCKCTAFSLFVNALVKIMLTQKNPTFAEEKEERFLLSGQLRRRVEILGGKPRIVLHSPAVATSIGEVKLSPHGDVMHNKLMVEMLRDKYKLSFDITESQSSFTGM